MARRRACTGDPVHGVLSGALLCLLFFWLPIAVAAIIWWQS